MRRFLPHLIAGAIATASLASAGCVVRGAAHVRVAEPELVYVGPNVWVVEDYDEPVFYSSNSYWLYRGGIWYRSGYYDRGWVRVGVHVVPGNVRRVDRPHRYVRYRAPANAKRRGPAVRDHRARPPARDNRARPPVRDHRQNERVKARPAPAQPAHGQTRDHRQKHDDRKAPPPKAKDKNKKKPSGNVRDHRDR